MLRGCKLWRFVALPFAMVGAGGYTPDRTCKNADGQRNRRLVNVQASARRGTRALSSGSASDFGVELVLEFVSHQARPEIRGVHDGHDGS
jgi:hypothetical protein